MIMSSDTLWDLYQAKDRGPFWGPRAPAPIGAGGERGMGAGGVYVKYPDGSMHWDETRADPKDEGGSVIDSTTGKAIPGANRQSGPTGPGGTGPVGSQARQGHVEELRANPSFASDSGVGSMLASGANNLMGANTVGSALSPGFGYAPPSSGVGLINTNPTAAGQTDPELKKMKDEYDAWQRNTWKVGSSLGHVGTQPGAGAEGGMGAGEGEVSLTPSQQASIDLTNKQLDNLMAIAQMENQTKQQAEVNRHNEALAKIQQDYQFHQDDVLLKQAEDAEAARHAQAQEQIQRDQIASNERIEKMREAHEIQVQQMQEGNAIYLQQGQQAFDSWSKGQDQRMQILGSALSNPWMQALSGMSPAPGTAPGTVVGGKNIAALVQQIMTGYDPKQWGVQNAPSIMGLTGSTAGGPSGGGTGSLPNFYNQSSAGGMEGTPSWQQWQQLSPWQKAAYRADQEALGPGVWNQMSAALGSQFASEGGTPNVTQMQAAGADPAGQAGMQMTGELYGQSGDQFWKNQNRMWSGAQAANVKQNLGGQQNLSGIAS